MDSSKGKCKYCGYVVDKETLKKHIHLCDENPKSKNYDEEVVNRKKLKGIGGWLDFFLFGLSVSLILTLITGFVDLSSVIPLNIISITILDILYYMSFIGLGIYTIYSLVKLKKNAVSLAKMYVSLTVLTNLMAVLISAFMGVPLASETSFFNSSQTIFRSLIFGIVWFLYFIYSKRINNTYPIKERKTYTIDKILFFFILAVPIVIYSLVFFGGSAQQFQGIAPTPSDLVAVYHIPQVVESTSLGICPTKYILGQDDKCHIPCSDSEHYCITGTCINNQCFQDCPSNYILRDDGNCYPSCGGSNTFCGTGTCYNNTCLTCPSGYALMTDGKCYPSQ